MKPGEDRRRLTSQPRPATDAETRLHGPVLLAVLQRRPDEQANDKNGGQEDEDAENDASRDVHPSKSSPQSGSPVRSGAPTCFSMEPLTELETVVMNLG